MAKVAFLSYTSEFRAAPQPKSFVAAASSAVVRAGYRPEEMSHLTSSGSSVSDVCAGMVEQSDVFIGLVGFRYGSPLRDRPGQSQVEFEYETATNLGRHRLVFLLGDDARSLPASSVIDREYGVRQDAFRRRLVASDGVVSYFADVDELELLVYLAVTQLVIPSVDVSFPEAREELERELSLVVVAAEAHGWRIRTRTISALRIVGPDGTTYSFPIGEPRVTRNELRMFARRLSDGGLRLNGTLLSPVGAPPGNPYA